MEGDGGFGGFLSLGREPGRGGNDVGTTLDMLSSLSRNGLIILGGGGGGGSATGGAGFSLKATATNWGDGRAKVSGSGFSGFYRARPARRVEVPALEQPLRADVENLSPDECWRLILKLGKRWPAWNKPTVSVPPSPQEKSHEPVAQAGQVSLNLLTTRALEALAQTPDRHGRSPRSMLALKMTTQEFLRTAGGSHPPTPTTSSQLDCQTLPVYQPSVSSMDVPKPGSRTAPLTIFYAGTVKVCEDVPEDKARLIMLFAEKAGSKPSARAPGEDLQLAPPASSHPPAAALVDPSSVRAPSHPSTRPEDSNAAAAEEMAMPPVTVTSRQGQGPPKPLPNARKSSLARFLDSRKRPKSTSGSEGQPSKRHSGASDDAEDLGRGKSTIDSVKERHTITTTTTDNAEVRP